MKKFNYLFMLLALVMLIAASCGKNGAVGPAGSQGATGAQGAVGPAGPPGANGQNGSVIYSGTTIPAATIGAVGDFYLNISTGLLYGPKIATGWGTGFSLQGPAGAAGAPGNKILSGTGAPASSLGSNGDYYLDAVNYLLYGPKTDGGWGAPVSFKGATGAQGPPGTANVMYTDWFTPTTYVKDTIFGSYGFYHDISIPAITQNVLDKGTVIAFAKLNGYVSSIWPTNQVGQLPIVITYMDGANANIDTWFDIASLGKVRVKLVSSLNAYGGISNAHQFRFVIIPGGVSIPGTLSYTTLQRYLRIPEGH
ncbi:hypothetical protein SAMN05421821_108135 [Mucilaginibacter lappiensis]|uniref:Collagen triple helix repeat-containing protein n=1 Tax=Mucilaginibacter lappiensis TaxID=354630 RepID=A0ABR6PJW1_9SPHI|nr:collagen-like protein [Mucilaginibacter lappiensis]MBB6110058.1 hypothetical protein [Mucilaginibacter lappiensis]SIR54190.1 hypothetical protein SAMN05421821_108135 [Mucilaginibacter lappiensis]